MLELIKEEKLLASSLLLALDDENSSKYREKCLKKGLRIDYTKINGMTHEELFSYFYKLKNFKKKDGWEMKFVKNDFMGLKLDLI